MAPAKSGFVTFETDLGQMGIAWGGGGIRQIVLPDGEPERLRERLGGAAGGDEWALTSAPATVRAAATKIRAHLAGRKADLTPIRLDLEIVPEFHRRVYAAARKVPPGATVTYGELATRAGAPGGARAVGQAMARNPFPPVVPCHRVLASGGRPGGFSSDGGLQTKARLLGIEGVALEIPWNRRRAVEEVCANDPRMKAIVRKHGPFRLRVTRDGGPYEALLKAIVYQQLSNKAAHSILVRLRSLFNGAKRDPTPRQIRAASDATLQSAGLSRAKVAAIQDLASKTVDGTVPTIELAHGLTDDELVERLTTIRGIGRWTVEMFLIFRLGRPDVLPVDDYAMRDGFAMGYGRAHPKPRELETFGERWRPWRTVASWYLWEVCGR